MNGGKEAKAQQVRLAKGVACLDITNPEIESLADFLTRVEAIKLGSSDGDEKTANLEDEPTPSAKKASLLGANHHRRSSKSDQSKRFYPLSTIIDSLILAASRAPAEGGEDVRGPGSEAIPYSAARVWAILQGLQWSWHHELRRPRTAAKNTVIEEEEPKNFSNKELDATARFFDLDSSGHIQLEDVMTAFREVRHDRCLGGRPSTPAMLILVALGRHLKENGITATHFVQKVALCQQNNRYGGHARSSFRKTAARGMLTKVTRPAKKA